MAEGIDTDDDMAAPEVSEEQNIDEEEHVQDAPQTLPEGPAPTAFAALANPSEAFLPAEDSELYLEEEMSLGEGALQPLEIEYEQPPLTAGGTVSQVTPLSQPGKPKHLCMHPGCCLLHLCIRFGCCLLRSSPPGTHSRRGRQQHAQQCSRNAQITCLGVIHQAVGWSSKGGP